MNTVQTLKEKAMQGVSITKEEALSLADQPLDELCQAANELREHFCDNVFDLCSIINGKSGKCSENCKYCAQSSHFCTAERQYRMPVPYGNQRTPTAQWTATASGCCLLGAEKATLAVTAVTCGRIVDLGVTDANNMGAAMAPAAFDTLQAHFASTGTTPEDYDLVLTGDLGVLGHQIVTDLFARDGVDMGKNYLDCGMLLYDIEKQDMHAGASGCGCSASVLCGYLLRKMEEGAWKKILFAPTGALLSPVSTSQGESIPGICHAIAISAVK